MREVLALAAGSLVCVGVLAADFSRVPRLRTPRLSAQRVTTALSVALERAGWCEFPQRTALAAAAFTVCAGALAGAASPALVPAGLAGAAACCLAVLLNAIERRRRRLAGELVPLLELFALELSGGGSALSALGSVTMQVDSELAGELRRMLIASQVAGSPSFEARLMDCSERIRIPALASLATVIGSSREFGTGASPGVRALATDLRRAQRRQLIEHSRRALNHVLLPAAVCILLPFLSVLMYPAVTVLQRSLR